MPLTLANKSDVRRHLMYSVAGLWRVSPSGGTLASGAVGYRFFQAYGLLEYRMNNLNPDEEARLIGLAYAAVALTGVQPNAGDTLSVTFSQGNLAAPVTITATMPTPQQNIDNRLLLIQILAGLCAQNEALGAAGIVALAPYGSGPFAETAVPFPECAFTSPVAFTFSATGTGNAYPQVTATGELLGPSTQLQPRVTTFGYLPILNGLEGAHASASQNLDTKQAAVWYSRSNEIALRTSLYRQWQQKMSDYLGIPINPERMNHARSVRPIVYA